MSLRSSHTGQSESKVFKRDSVSGAGRQVVLTLPAGGQTALWLIVVLLAVIATVLVLRWDGGGVMQSAYAQSGDGGPVQVGARGIYAFTGQLTGKSYGLFMLDVDTGTIWCYEFQRGTDEPRMQLVAARSWLWDRYLEEFNVADPVPGAVRAMVEQQRSRREDVAVPEDKTINAQ